MEAEAVFGGSLVLGRSGLVYEGFGFKTTERSNITKNLGLDRLRRWICLE